jgi:aspartate ammonia-lyase
MIKTRIEYDSLGELHIPQDAYWGIHTGRAVQNFPISGRCVNSALIRALAKVKSACSQANLELGYLDETKGSAILESCREIADGKFAGEFPVDALQGGAGTSTNMNMNEVIANRAIELLGGGKGDYTRIHPIDDVNLHQSTNDVFPTAIRIAAIQRLRDLSGMVARLQGAFQEKEKEFGGIVKIGRTELQEAVPMTLGLEFSAFSEAFSRDRWRTFKCEERLRVVNIGGTAIGTGLTAPRDYIFLVIEKLREETGFGLARGENIAGETANADAFVEVSGILKAHAANLIKITNDLRFLNAAGEIQLHALQAGSSIMPGKVNPVMMEAAIQVGIKVNANDYIITETANRGTLQINEFLPLLAEALLESLDILVRTDSRLEEEVRQIVADPLRCMKYVEKSPMIVTAFVPYIGYDRAGDLAAEYAESGETNVKAFLEKKLGQKLVDTVLSPYHLTALGFRKEE